MFDMQAPSQLAALTRAISVLEQRHTQEISIILPRTSDVVVEHD